MVVLPVLWRCGLIDMTNAKITLGTYAIEQDLEDTYFYEVSVPCPAEEKISVYVAKIYGVDEVYRLQRVFIRPGIDFCDGKTLYSYSLKDGVYDVGFSRYSRRDGKLLERQRFVMILFDGKQYSYPYDELKDDLEYIAFCFWVQDVGEEQAARMFFAKGVSNGSQE